MKKFLAMLLVVTMLIGFVPFTAEAAPVPADKEIVWWGEVYDEYHVTDAKIADLREVINNAVAQGVDIYIDILAAYSVAGPADAEYIYDGPNGERFVNLTDTNEFVNELAEPGEENYMISGAWLWANISGWMLEDWKYGDKNLYVDVNTLPVEPEYIWWGDFYGMFHNDEYDYNDFKVLINDAMAEGINFFLDIKAYYGVEGPADADWIFDGPNGERLVSLADTNVFQDANGSDVNVAGLWTSYLGPYYLTYDWFNGNKYIFVDGNALPASPVPVFEKVTDLSELKDGDRILLAYPDEKDAQLLHVMSGNNAGNFRNSTNVYLRDNKVVQDSEVSVLTLGVEEVAGACQYTLNDGNFVLYFADNGNKVNTGAAQTNSSDKWYIEANDDGTFAIRNLAFTERFLQYNTTSPRFACYRDSQEDLVIYKYNPEAILPPENPMVYSLTGPKVETLTAGKEIYIVGSDFYGENFSLMGNLEGYSCTAFEAVNIGDVFGYRGSPLALTVGGDAENGYTFQRADGKYLSATISGDYINVKFVADETDHLWLLTEEGFLQNKTLFSGENPVFLEFYNGSFSASIYSSAMHFYAVGGENGASTLLPGMSVTLSSILDVNFKLEGDTTDYTMEAIIGDKVVEAPLNEAGYFVAPLKIAQLGETITAVLKYKGEAVMAFQDTVKAYTDRLKYYYADDTELVALCDALLVYGDFAAKYVAGTASVAGAIELAGELSDTLAGYDMMTEEWGIPERLTTKRLVLKDAVTMQFKFCDEFASNPMTSFKYGYCVDGDTDNIKDLSELEDNIFTLDNISVQNWDKMVDVCIVSWSPYDNDWVKDLYWADTQVIYCPMSYVYEQLTRTEGEEIAPGLDNLLIAMANYWMAAEAYIAAN